MDIEDNNKITPEILEPTASVFSDLGVDDDSDDNDDETTANSASEMTKPFDPTEINIIPKQDSLVNLIERLRNNEIDMHTEFQRQADLWNPKKMSRFIESILIRFPLPAFYFDASDDNNWLIVDGLQRLSSINRFVIKEDLALCKLEYLEKLEGLKYSDLSRNFCRRINECPITLFTIQPGTPEEVKYSIFRRINTGGLVLNNQEIRHAMATNKLRSYMKTLTREEFFIKTVGDISNRMRDQEYVLRFLAFYKLDYISSSREISTFLDNMMDEMKNNRYDLDELHQIFTTAMKRCWEMFCGRAFEKKGEGNDIKSRRKNSSLFEVWTVNLAKLTEDEYQKVLMKKEQIIKKHTQLMTDDSDYLNSISYSTHKKEHYKIRHERVKALIREVINA